jgi:non-ribosomal peptide synthetase component F
MPTPEYFDATTTGKPVHETVTDVSRVIPARTAVRTGTDAVTYRELDLWARGIARRLGAADVGHGDRVGVLVEPSPGMVAAALGILRAGASYVPIDLTRPDHRLAGTLADTVLDATVASRTAAQRLPQLGLPPLPSVAVERSNAWCKGFPIEHTQLSASTPAWRTVHPSTPVLLLLSPLSYDHSATGLWGTLTAGGRLIVATPDEARDPKTVTTLVERHRVTQLLCAPSLYSAFLDAAERLGPERLRSLATVTLTGEPLPQALLDRHFAVLEQVSIGGPVSDTPRSRPAILNGSAARSDRSLEPTLPIAFTGAATP